jgi:peptidoglycan/LPS O-acetylase OafA/YrhL
MQHSDRNEIIDGFRGVAIVSVLLFHFLLRWRAPESPVDLLGYDHVFSRLFEVGRYGVHLFFVISGLVITMTLLRAKTVAEFAVRRFARIYPAFLVAATLTFVIMALFGPALLRTSVADYGASLLLIPEEFGFHYVDGAYWSLAYELKFYFWIAICRLLLGERFWIGAIALGVLGELIAPVHEYFATRVLLAPYMPLFLLGMGGWFAIFERRLVVGWTCMGAAALLYLASVVRLHSDAPDVLIPIYHHVYIWALALLMLALLAFTPRLRFGPLAWIGRISYSLYLLHQNLGVTLIGALKHAGAPDWLAFALPTALCLAAAAALYAWVEIPAKNAIMALYRTRRARPPVAEGH